MIGLDIWMREHPLTYVWIGSYAVALMILVAEVAMVVHRRKASLQQIRLLRDARDDAGNEETA
jgi:heme exporter protein D